MIQIAIMLAVFGGTLGAAVAIGKASKRRTEGPSAPVESRWHFIDEFSEYDADKFREFPRLADGKVFSTTEVPADEMRMQ